MSALISPQLGNTVYFASELINAAPNLEPEKLDQIAALPIGGRLMINPWSDQAELLKTKPISLVSPREKMPFEVTPFMPFLTRYESSKAGNKPPESLLSGTASPEAHVNP